MNIKMYDNLMIAINEATSLKGLEALEKILESIKKQFSYVAYECLATEIYRQKTRLGGRR